MREGLRSSKTPYEHIWGLRPSQTPIKYIWRLRLYLTLLAPG